MAVKFKNCSRQFFAAVLLIMCGMVLSGCRLFDESEKFGALPEPPVSFTQKEYCHPDHPEDGYMAVEYNGRLYVPYGTLKGMITPKDVKECVGYICREDDPEDKNAHLHTLTDDPDVNYLMEYYVNGLMEQPNFYRAVDTAGEDIYTPTYIDSLDYDIWK